MPTNIEIFNQMKDLADEASAKAGEYSGFLGEVRHFILENFGSNGLIAAYIVLAAFIVLVVSKIAGLTFSALKFLVLPAIVLAFLASLFLPYSFFTALPITVTVCSLIMIFKG